MEMGPTAAAGPLMDVPVMLDGDRYELVRDIGSGNFGVARLMRCRASGDLVAVKYIDRGEKVPPPNRPPPPSLQLIDSTTTPKSMASDSLMSLYCQLCPCVFAD